jgi:hypothetical protein
MVIFTGFALGLIHTRFLRYAQSCLPRYAIEKEKDQLMWHVACVLCAFFFFSLPGAG